MRGEHDGAYYGIQAWCITAAGVDRDSHQNPFRTRFSISPGAACRPCAFFE
jgi:hypothetical protein